MAFLKFFRRKVNEEGEEQGEVPPSPASSSNVFGQVNELREARKSFIDDDDDEEEKFNTDTIWGRIAVAKWFELTTMFLITLNSLAIGYETNYSARFGKPDNLYEGPWGFIVIENFFALYFSGEVLIRFVAYTVKSSCLTDAWFIFDSVLVTFMVLETWVLPIAGGGGMLAQLAVLRLLRLLRITRMARLMRAVPELMTIVKGMIAATRTVLSTAVLLFMCTYTWAILFTSTYHQGRVDDADLDGEDAAAFFGSMGKSVFSLLVMGTILDDLTACVDAIRGSGNDWMLVAFLVYILIASFTILNMLVGVLVEVVQKTAAKEKESGNASRVKDEVKQVFIAMDDDNSGEISHDEFMAMMRMPKVLEALAQLHVKEKHFKLYAELLFLTDTDGISFEELFATLKQLRPGNEISALDFRSFDIGLCYGIGQKGGKDTWKTSHDSLRDKIQGIEQSADEFARDPSYPVTNGALLGEAYLAPAPAAATNIGTKKDGRLTSNSKMSRQLSYDRQEFAELDDLAKNIDLEMLERLDRAASAQIMEELERRLGIVEPLLSACSGSAPAEAEGFMTLGVPQNI